MKKFVFLYNMSGEDENTKEHMDTWMAWFQSIGKDMVDTGNPLVGGKEVKLKKAKSVTPEMGIVSGYSIINATDMESAIEIAKGCPGKTGLRVYEALPM